MVGVEVRYYRAKTPQAAFDRVAPHVLPVRNDCSVSHLGCNRASNAPRRAVSVAFEPSFRFLGDARAQTRFVCPADTTVTEELRPVVARAGFVIDLPADATETALNPVTAADLLVTRQAWNWQHCGLR